MDKQVSLRIFIGLIVLYAVLAGVSVFLPQGAAATPLAAPMPAPLPVMAMASGLLVLTIYGVIGLVGFFLARRLGLPELWDSHTSNRQRFLLPALTGAATGVLVIIGDLLLRSVNGFGPFPHPPFPTSLVASVTAGIGEETAFRLFFICLWTWIVSRLVLRGRLQSVVYWVVASFSAVAFGLGHLPSIMFLRGWTSVAEVPVLLIVELLLLNGAISLPAAYFLKKVGFLGAVGVHFWADVVWHVIWGLF